MNADEIKRLVLAADDRSPVAVEVPEWPAVERVWMRPFCGDDRDWWDQLSQSKLGEREDGSDKDLRGLRAAAVARSWCTEDGDPLGFTEAEVALLGQKSARALQRCFSVVCELSGLGEDAYDDAKKNSPPAPSENSGSS